MAIVNGLNEDEPQINAVPVIDEKDKVFSSKQRRGKRRAGNSQQ